MINLRKIRQNQLKSWVLAIVAFQLVFPQQSLKAQTLTNFETVNILPNFIVETENQTESETIGLIFPLHESTPEPQYEVVKTYQITVTAYSSTPDQTDSTPCITANGFDLCAHDQEDIIAANFLPFGAKVRIPEYFGNRIFTVQDRMNARYYYRADIWFKNRQDAINFGAPYTAVEIVELAQN